MGKHMQSDCNNNKHCSNHDQDGHTFSECYSKGGGSEGKGPQQKRKVKWMMKDKELEEKKGSESTHQVLTLEQCNVAFASWEPELIFVKDEWLADSSVDAKDLCLRNPKKALPIYMSRLKNKASHKCIIGVGRRTIHI